MRMKHLDRMAESVLSVLVEGLCKVGDHKKVDNAAGAFMAVSVEWIDTCDMGPLFSVSHYYEQNGDLMRDPEMVFLRGLAGHFYPTYFRQDGGLGYEQESVNLQRGTFNAAAQADQAQFANSWMVNIRDQQALDVRTAQPGH